MANRENDCGVTDGSVDSNDAAAVPSASPVAGDWAPPEGDVCFGLEGVRHPGTKRWWDEMAEAERRFHTFSPLVLDFIKSQSVGRCFWVREEDGTWQKATEKQIKHQTAQRFRHQRRRRSASQKRATEAAALEQQQQRAAAARGGVAGGATIASRLPFAAGGNQQIMQWAGRGAAAPPQNIMTQGLWNQAGAFAVAAQGGGGGGGGGVAIPPQMVLNRNIGNQNTFDRFNDTGAGSGIEALSTLKEDPRDTRIRMLEQQLHEKEFELCTHRRDAVNLKTRIAILEDTEVSPVIIHHSQEARESRSISDRKAAASATVAGMPLEARVAALEEQVANHGTQQRNHLSITRSVASQVEDLQLSHRNMALAFASRIEVLERLLQQQLSREGVPERTAPRRRISAAVNVAAEQGAISLDDIDLCQKAEAKKMRLSAHSGVATKISEGIPGQAGGPGMSLETLANMASDEEAINGKQDNEPQNSKKASSAGNAFEVVGSPSVSSPGNATARLEVPDGQEEDIESFGLQEKHAKRIFARSFT